MKAPTATLPLPLAYDGVSLLIPWLSKADSTDKKQGNREKLLEVFSL